MRVLYLHPAGAYGGASKSLIEFFNVLKKSSVEGVIVSPKGTASKAFKKAGMTVIEVNGLTQFDNTKFGHYRRLRWLILIREVIFIPSVIYAIWKIRNQKCDLIHINEITLLPIGIFAKKILKLPILLHVRSLQCYPEFGWRTRFINQLLKKYADSIVAIDETVASTLPDNLGVTVIHNGIDINHSKELVNLSLDINEQRIRIGFLGVLIRMKGIYELIDAIKILRQRGLPIKCLIFGENPRELLGVKGWLLKKFGFAENVRKHIEDIIIQDNLFDFIELKGFIQDIRVVYPHLDILCFPSHLNAAGRPVFEAALYGIPSVVAVKNPKSDAILHEHTGLAIPSSDPLLIANALECLIVNEEFRKKLGIQAKEWANKNFSIEKSANSIYSIYDHIVKR